MCDLNFVLHSGAGQCRAWNTPDLPQGHCLIAVGFVQVMPIPPCGREGAPAEAERKKPTHIRRSQRGRVSDQKGQCAIDGLTIGTKRLTDEAPHWPVNHVQFDTWANPGYWGPSQAGLSTAMMPVGPP